MSSGSCPTALAYSARAVGIISAMRTRCGTSAGRRSDSSRTNRREGGSGTGWIDCSLGRARLLWGQLDAARTLARHAVDSASDRTDFLPDALQLLGDIETHPDVLDAERGQDCYADALALAEERGMRPLVAHCHLGLGRLHRATGDGARAREHLVTAAAMYREMDMRFWLQEASPTRQPRNSAGHGARPSP